MMKKILLAVTVLLLALPLLALPVQGQDLPLLKVSQDKHYLVTQDDEPFLWLGGTAWELIHRLNKQEVDLYLEDRAKKGFTVIQTVVLAELDGLNVPNAYGEKPLINNDPTVLNEKYFKHVDYVVTKAAEQGLYVGLLPTWGDKFNQRWGVGPEVFTPDNAEKYGELLAARYLEQKNIVWILGGDRIPEKDEHFQIILAMAKGIRNVDREHLITYHPPGGKKAIDLVDEDWLDVDMFQSGHSRLSKEYDYVRSSRNHAPVRPVINGESRYENIMDRFWEPGKHDWLDDSDVRVSAYWSMLSGAAGYTYGCNDIWQMYESGKSAPTLSARTDWFESIHLPGARQMKFMRDLLAAIPWQTLEYDPSLILNENPENEAYIVSAIGANRDIILAYSPMGKPISLDFAKLKAPQVQAYWFNPRSGQTIKAGDYEKTDKPLFKPWAVGRGSDFLLIILSKDSSIELPGLR